MKVGGDEMENLWTCCFKV